MISLIGQQLGRYEIQEEIGRGGMARVYRARDTLLHRTVALKVLAPQLALDTEYIRRFKREAIIAASFRHPNIVTIFDVSESDGLHYIAMEYIRGRTLHAIINERGALGLGYAIAIIGQVAAALDYAHSRDAVHRDIKPHNIMIDAEGGVLLTDFGIAQAPETRDGERLTRTGIFMGTPEYISPEQASAQRVDGRSDLYSLAITAYEVITGTVPFSGATPQLMIAHLQTPPPSLATIDPSQPVELDVVLARALAKNPDRRFATGAAFMEALRIVARKHDIPIPDPEQLADLALPRSVPDAQKVVRVPLDPTERGPSPMPGADRVQRQPAREPRPAIEPVLPRPEPQVEPDTRLARDSVLPEPRFDRRWAAMIAIVIAMLAVTAVLVRGDVGGGEPPTAQPTGQPTQAASPAPTIAPVPPTLAPSSTPTHTPLPTDTPTSQPEPTAAPQPTARPPVRPPTAVPEPPTDTPEPPTDTPEPPTDTPEPPTDTPELTAYPEPSSPTTAPPTTAPTQTPAQPSPTLTATASASPTTIATTPAINPTTPTQTLVLPSLTPTQMPTLTTLTPATLTPTSSPSPVAATATTASPTLTPTAPVASTVTPASTP